MRRRISAGTELSTGEWPRDLPADVSGSRNMGRDRSLPESCSRLWSRRQGQGTNKCTHIFARDIEKRKEASWQKEQDWM